MKTSHGALLYVNWHESAFNLCAFTGLVQQDRSRISCGACLAQTRALQAITSRGSATGLERMIQEAVYRAAPAAKRGIASLGSAETMLSALEVMISTARHARCVEWESLSRRGVRGPALTILSFVYRATSLMPVRAVPDITLLCVTAARQ